MSGGDIGARDAKLSIMVGGDKEVFEKVTPLFQVYLLFLYDGSAWERISSTWAWPEVDSTPRCATRFLLLPTWYMLHSPLNVDWRV